jgi:glycosyltransferase involved in cell wall biosynthesis
MNGSATAKRPRIGVDFHTFDGIFQGSRSHVLGLFAEVVQLPSEFEYVLLLDEPERLRREHPVFDQPHVRLVRMPHRPGPVRVAVQLAWYQWRQHLDLLHTQYRIPLLPVGDCACTIHDVLFERHPQFFSSAFTWQSKLTFRWSARHSKLLFSVSEFSRDDIARCYGVAPARIGVLYNGVDRSRFYPGEEGVERLASLGLQPRAYLLTVGRLEPRKNHARLIEAWASLGRTAPPLVCVGQRDFGYETALAVAARLGVSDRLHFLEDVGDSLLPVLMRNARVFAFPALAEGFGMPVVEAMASGVPVLTSCSTALPEVAGGAAELVNPNDVADIARGLRRLLDDSALVARRIADGLRNVERFAWMRSAQTLVAAYRTHFALDGMTGP